MVLQETHLFTGTVMDNIRYGNLEATDEECIEAAKLILGCKEPVQFIRFEDDVEDESTEESAESGKR